jgi:uncharacterized membrane protein YdjX (TVP38/TMEM64 family)
MLQGAEDDMMLRLTMSKFNKKAFITLILVTALVLVWLSTDLDDSFSLKSIQKNAAALKKQVNANYLLGTAVFMTVYITMNLWFPAAAVLTLLAGFLYGTVWGAIYVDIAATLGATLAFEISRNFVGNWIQHRWRRQLIGFNTELSRRGYAYLLFVRLIPMMPYILINFLAGLTRIRLRTFIWTTAVGSLPGILIFSYAGGKLLSITSVEQVFTSEVITAFVLLVGFAGLAIVIRILTSRKQKDISEEC